MEEEIKSCDECAFVKMCSHQHKEEKCGGKMFKQMIIEKKIEIIRQWGAYKNEDRNK